MGWENIFQVEKDEFCQKVLEKNFPETKIYGDIKEFDGTQYRRTIDIITGGFPCQPYSYAGKRKGNKDDRHLWPEMLRVIREIQPKYVVGENVRGLTNWNGGVVFDEVQADLEDEGYDVIPFLLPACGIGAPHRRDRIWFIAHSDSQHSQRESIEKREIKSNGRTWDTWPLAEPDLRRGNDGVPNRLDRLKSLGNAIVPQVALQIFKAIEEVNSL